MTKAKAKKHIKAISLVLCIMLAGCSYLIKKREYAPDLSDRIVKNAAQHIGVPYQYGGNTPVGFDCSGFTWYAMKQAGIDIPRIVKEQYSAGRSVSKSDLQKGDLVFFSTKWGAYLGIFFPPSHVGIYTGNGKFIHSPKTGGFIRYDSMDNPYWKHHYKGARDFISKR